MKDLQESSKVPSGRFYNKVKLDASGAGGFTKDTGAVAMNFLIVDKQAAIQYQKHTVSKVISRIRTRLQMDGNSDTERLVLQNVKTTKRMAFMFIL